MNFLSISALFAVLILVLLFSVEASACACPDEVSDCNVYGLYPGIYTGTLVSSEPEASSFVNVRFKIDHVYKGTSTEFLTLKFRTSECSPAWKAGERYLVFQNGSPIQQLCNNTALLSDSSELVAILNGISRTEPKFLIDIRFTGLTPERLLRGRIYINGEEQRLDLRDSRAEVRFKTSEDSVYEIKIVFPEKLDIRVGGDKADIDIKHDENLTEMRYRVRYIADGCHLSVFRLSEKTIDDDNCLKKNGHL